MIKPYYPNTQPEQLAWWQNFKTQFNLLYDQLGFTDLENDAVQGFATWAIYLLGSVRGLVEEFSKGVTGYVRSIFYSPKGSPAVLPPVVPTWPAVPVGIAVTMGIDELRQEIVGEIKHKPAYDASVHGPLLGIEPTGDPFDPTTYQAVIRDARCTGPGEVRLKLGKANGAIDANKVSMRRKGETAWRDLGNFTKAEVFDRTPLATPGQPEEREYRVQGVLNDALIGLPSDIEAVLVRA